MAETIRDGFIAAMATLLTGCVVFELAGAIVLAICDR